MSEPTGDEHDLAPAVRASLRAAAAALAAEPGFHPQERDDITQELAAAWLARRGGHDPARGSLGTFLRAVLASAAADLRRRRFAARRDPNRLRPAALERLAGPQPSPDELDARIDAEAVLAGLSAEDGELMRAYADRRVAALARERGVSARKLRQRARTLLAQLREVVSDPGAASLPDALA